MNKLVKLPLFLGICGAACAGVLAGVYMITAPIVEQAKIDKANKAYIEMYKKYNVTSNDIHTQEATGDLLAAGCSVRAVVENNNVKGIAYTCEAKGYGGTISFQVAFANGKYLAFNNLGNSETPSFGGVVIGNMSNLISGKDGSVELLSDATYTAAISGKSITGTALAKSIEKCRVDYMAWYEAK